VVPEGWAELVTIIKVRIQSTFFEVDVDGCSEYSVNSAKNEPDAGGQSRIEGMDVQVSLLCILGPVPLSSLSSFLLPLLSRMADTTED
jgi:hypothetical protein